LYSVGPEGKNRGEKDGGSFDAKVAVNGNPLTKVYVRLALMNEAGETSPKGRAEKMPHIF